MYKIIQEHAMVIKWNRIPDACGVISKHKASESASSTIISNESLTEGLRIIFQLRLVSHGYLCVVVVRNTEGIRDFGRALDQINTQIRQRKKKSQ